MAVSCPKCGGDGVVERYRNHDHGVCYLCGGKGDIRRGDANKKSNWVRFSPPQKKQPKPAKGAKNNMWRDGKTGKAKSKNQK